MGIRRSSDPGRGWRSIEATVGETGAPGGIVRSRSIPVARGPGGTRAVEHVLHGGEGVSEGVGLRGRLDGLCGGLRVERRLVVTETSWKDDRRWGSGGGRVICAAVVGGSGVEEGLVVRGGQGGGLVGEHVVGRSRRVVARLGIAGV